MGPLVELSEISKSFGSKSVLERVSLSLQSGEVHVLAGENGAGKSTLMRILCGDHSDYSGEIRMQGRALRFAGPEDAARFGIATIHQELSLIGAMTVADNLFLGERGKAWAPWKRAEKSARARRFLLEYGLSVDPDAAIESLPLSTRQQLEIARALLGAASVLIMDEPTSALSEPEVRALFTRIRELTAKGVGVLYISHRMEEIFSLADRITVLRDGRHVLTTKATELDAEGLIRAMVGAEVRSEPRARTSATAAVALDVRELTLAGPRGAAPALDGLSFALKQGEIVGVAGLAGSGASELLHCLFGAGHEPVHGAISLFAQPFAPKGPRAALAAGVGLLANDRADNLVGALGAVENATLSALSRWSRAGRIERDAELSAARDGLEYFAFAGHHSAPERALRLPVEELSGGNQQKVALARCWLAQPRLLLLDEPTRGIDVAAKAEIYARLRLLAASGTTLLLIASELDELFLLCDRILVLQRGRLVGELPRSDFSRERVLALAMRGAA